MRSEETFSFDLFGYGLKPKTTFFSHVGTEPACLECLLVLWGA